jgi:hypothetical protein
MILLLSIFALMSSFVRCVYEGGYAGYGGYNGYGGNDNGGYDRAKCGGLSYSEWRDFCKVDSDWVKRNQCPYDSTGNYSAYAGVSVKLPGASTDRNLTYVVDIPYWIVTTYKESSCKFNFRLEWFVVCDAITCPLIPPGLYMAVQETSNRIIVPRNPSREMRQEYHQIYETSPIPGNPDQNTWSDIHISITPHWVMGLYSDINGKVAYEELISMDVPHKHLSHSAQSYQPSSVNTGLVFMNPWADIDYIDSTNGTLPEPAKTVYTLYSNGQLPLVTYDNGKSAYMTLIVPSSSNGKRVQSQSDLPVSIPQTDYDKYFATATIAKQNNVASKTTMW